MDFADATLLRLASEAGRAAVLDQTCLADLSAAAFDLSLDPLSGPYALALDSAQLGIELSPPVALEGTWRGDASLPTELRLLARGLRLGDPLRADALWRGELVARRNPADSVIETADVRFAALDLDRAIVAASGNLPANPAQLERARRAQLLTRLRAGMGRGGLLDDDGLTGMLREAGHADVASLLSARGTTALGAIRIGFSQASAGPPVPVRLPVTVVVLVRAALSPLLAVLSDARALRDHLARDPDVLPPPAPLRRRAQVVPLLVVPDAIFGTADWPGANPAARRTAAAEFLARESIGLAVASP